MDEWDWHRTIEVNLSGAFLTMQTVGRIMRARGGGVIINLASLSGGTVVLDRSAYVASLFGLIGLTRQAARELFAFGIASTQWGVGWDVSKIPAPPSLRTCPGRSFSCAVRVPAHLTGHIVNLP